MNTLSPATRAPRRIVLTRVHVRVCVGGAVEEHVHEHGLAHTHVTVEVDSLVVAVATFVVRVAATVTAVAAVRVAATVAEQRWVKRWRVEIPWAVWEPQVGAGQGMVR